MGLMDLGSRQESIPYQDTKHQWMDYCFVGITLFQGSEFLQLLRLAQLQQTILFLYSNTGQCLTRFPFLTKSNHLNNVSSELMHRLNVARMHLENTSKINI